MLAEIFTNPVVVSVLVMCILCLLRLNIFIIMFIVAIIAGLLGGMDIPQTMKVFMGGMGENLETATAYVLLGAIAIGISRTGLTTMLSNWLEKVFKGKKHLFLIVLALISSLSQNLIPVNISFIPIVVPPLLLMMNEMRIDRRAAAVSLGWGLKASYMIIPAGFGLIFHKLISSNMEKNGMILAVTDVWKAMFWPAGIGMTLGLLVAIFILYNKPRDYKNVELESAGTELEMKNGKVVFGRRQIGALLGGVSTFVIQLLTESLVLGGVVGLLIMLAFGCFPYKDFDDILNEGIGMIGWIAFVMLASSGFSEVITASNGVESLIGTVAVWLSGSKIIASTVMILIGLIIVMGTGTTFGTVPILAVIYVPLCAALGYSPLGTACVIGAAAGIGDVSSPASDGTLGPTAGLNADGQHDHIWDSSVPAFITFCIPYFVIGVIASVLL